MTAQPINQSDRRFMLVLYSPVRRRLMRLPTNKNPLFTGEQTLQFMLAYKRSAPKVQTLAQTETNGEYGVYTLDEMKELFQPIAV